VNPAAPDPAHFHPAICIIADDAGESHLVDLHLPIAFKESAADGTVVWTGLFGAGGFGIAAAASGGDHASWHVSVLPGMSIVLVGSWEIEASDGARRVLEAGSILVMLDQHGKGHFSREGRGPCATMGVSFDAATTEAVRALAQSALAESALNRNTAGAD
jgi:hypothetical protein